MKPTARLAAVAVVAALALAGGPAAAGEGIFANHDSPASKMINHEIDRRLQEHRSSQDQQPGGDAESNPGERSTVSTQAPTTTEPAEQPESSSDSESSSDTESDSSTTTEPAETPATTTLAPTTTAPPTTAPTSPASTSTIAAPPTTAPTTAKEQPSKTGPGAKEQEPGSDRTTRETEEPPPPAEATVTAWTAWQDAYTLAHTLADVKRTHMAAAGTARGAYDACIASHGGINAPGVRSTFDGRVIVCPAEREAWETAMAAYNAARAPYDAHVRGHDSPYHTALDAWESAMCDEGLGDGQAYHTASPWWMSNAETWTSDALIGTGAPEDALTELDGGPTSSDPEHATSWLAWQSQAC